MSSEWYLGIQEACRHWRDANMLQQTFDSFETSLASRNDAIIDACKGLVECVCHVIIDELDDPASPLKPTRDDVPINEWVATATRLLKLGDSRHRKFADMIKHHNNLADSLRQLRNDAGPISHGRDGFINTLSVYHHRATILSADAIITFLHQAYLEIEPNLLRTHEPYDRFTKSNQLIDENISVIPVSDDDGKITFKITLATGDTFVLPAEPSRLLFHLDREAYVEALAAAKSARLASALGQGGD